MNGLVSIIMPAYNVEAYISNSINSVISQTYGNWELVIVDDCSTDNTVEIIKGFNDSRIRLFSNDTNSGAAVSRNYALREARGKWIAFLDSDDIWAPEKLEKQLAFMIENGYGFTFTDYRVISDGKLSPYILYAPDVVNKRKLYDYCYMSTTTVIYDREKVGLIQIADLRKRNDYAMWFQALDKTDAYRFPECLSYYVRHSSSISSGSKLKLVKWHYRLFRIGLNESPAKSVLLTMNNITHGIVKKIKYKMPATDEPVLPSTVTAKQTVTK